MVFLAFATGLAAALAGRAELKVSPRHALLTRSFAAFAIFDVLVLVPACAYFYVFHGDWFLLYSYDVQDIPSAIALVGFVLLGLLAVLGFGLSAALVRTAREAWAGALLAITSVAALATPLAVLDRLSVVGTHAQYRGNFGLEPFEGGPLLSGALAMGTILALGLAFLVARLWLSGSRRA